MEKMLQAVLKRKISKIYKYGVDVITGNYIWDQQEILSFIDKDLRLLDLTISQKNVQEEGLVYTKFKMGQKF